MIVEIPSNLKSRCEKPMFLIEILGIWIEILGFSFKILGISKICDNRIPYD